MMRDIKLIGGPSLSGGRIVASIDTPEIEIDAAGLDILPGLIDVHGDAFERAVSPRPGVTFPVDIALAELETHLLGAGITTAFLAITLSWEPGLRSRATYEMLRDAVRSRPAGAVPDLKLHVRFEAHNLADLDMLLADIAAGHIGMISFNDHTPGIVRKLGNQAASAKYAERAGQKFEDFAAVARQAMAIAPEAVEAGRRRLAEAARHARIPMASHDEPDIAARASFRALGSKTSEFPITREVARDAISHGEEVVMGAPNVVRGGSHMGWHGAEALVQESLCTVLCSDYHYPSLLQAIYRIARNGSADFSEAAALVTRNAARLAWLSDRGDLNLGQRADLILVDPQPVPRLAVVIVGGVLAYAAPEYVDRLSIKATRRDPAASTAPSLAMTASG
jgi:alpha-D-ribose 1-methylphosphonate 5-triphosphate diphosphatase